MLLTDELVANIATMHGCCGENWYVTSDDGVLYLHVKDSKGLFFHPILICEPIMRHLGYLRPSNPLPKEHQPDEERITFEDMKEQICAYVNTCSPGERKGLFAQCHFPTTAVNDLHVEDAQKLYNIIKVKLYGKH